MAPHVFVEPVCLQSIAKIRDAYLQSASAADGLRSRLAKYHARVDDAFLGWADAWLAPDFRAWTIEDLIGAVAAPMLLIQGRDDEYGTLAQLDRIETRATGPVSRLVLDACGHAPTATVKRRCSTPLPPLRRRFSRASRDRPSRAGPQRRPCLAP